MRPSLTGAAPLLEVGVASRARLGESVSGDQYVVCDTPTGVVVAVVDGLGHGPEAAAAAHRAVDVLSECSSQPVTVMVRSAHAALVGSRGAALAAAQFGAGGDRMTWLAVGNVEAALVRAEAAAADRLERVVPGSGVVGLRLPPLRAAVVHVARGDVLVLATDGLRPELTSRLGVGAAPQPLADELLQSYAMDSDDALVLVARYRGQSRLP